MSLVCLSFSHKHVPISIRETLYFDADATANACARFRCGQDKPGQLTEMVVLSTCNRTEIYACTSTDWTSLENELAAREICQFVADARGLDVAEVSDLGRWYVGDDVIRHICRVACGLESLVLGEPQILGQVGDAMKIGLVMDSCGIVLTKLFQASIKAGRRARHQTRINQGSLNISTAAVSTAERELGSVRGKSVVLLGAGEMAELALEQLTRRGVGEIFIVNRTIESAKILADKYNGQPLVFEQMMRVLPTTDILICSTGAPHTLITKQMIQLVMPARSGRQLMILDIAVPRDVEQAVDEIPNVMRCDIDDLYIATGNSASLRDQQIPEVEQMIEAEFHQFVSWYRSVGIEPTISELRLKADGLRRAELHRLASMIPDVSEAEWGIIERFSKSLMNKLLHDPTVRLRNLHGTRGATDHAQAIRELFDLEIADESQFSSTTPTTSRADA
jgi:glutamyl-tRNA reductase